jgi:hypothetical protein
MCSSDNLGASSSLGIRSCTLSPRIAEPRPHRPECAARAGLSSPRKEHLDRHVATKSRITSAIDLSHPAGTKWGEDFICAETSAGSEGHAYFTGTRRFSSSTQLRTTTRVGTLDG